MGLQLTQHLWCKGFFPWSWRTNYTIPFWVNLPGCRPNVYIQPLCCCLHSYIFRWFYGISLFLCFYVRVFRCFRKKCGLNLWSFFEVFFAIWGWMWHDELDILSHLRNKYWPPTTGDITRPLERVPPGAYAVIMKGNFAWWVPKACWLPPKSQVFISGLLISTTSSNHQLAAMNRCPNMLSNWKRMQSNKQTCSRLFICGGERFEVFQPRVERGF